MSTAIKNENSFLDKLMRIDFDLYYSKKVRFLCHLFMWLFLTSFYPLTYHLIYDYSWNDSLLFSLRLVLCNASVFYITFYASIPFLLNKNKIFLFILSIIGIIQIWLIINHYFFSLTDYLNIKFNDIIFNDLIKKNSNTRFIDVIFSTKIVSQFIEIINFISPFFFIKIAFDLTRTYAKKIKTTKELEYIKYENVVIENKFLQSQLNPHFLFNTLNNLYGLSLRKDDLTPQLILKLAEVLRYTLYDANVEKLPLEKEIEFIENYIEMERMRYSDKCNISFKIIKSDTTDFNNLYIAPLISFVFIENAFKYGLKSNTPFLNIFIELHNNKVLFNIQNDIDLLSKKTNKAGGIGLENVIKRLNLLYLKKHSLTIINDDKSFNILLSINL